MTNREQILLEGKLEGRLKGKAEGIKSVALNLQTLGFDLSIIKKTTGLTEVEILALRKETS